MSDYAIMILRDIIIFLVPDNDREPETKRRYDSHEQNEQI